MSSEIVDNDRVLGIAVARRQLEKLDSQLEAMLKGREVIAAYLKAMTGEALPAAPSVLNGATAERPNAPQERVYQSRQFNKRVVEEALEIIAKHGKPMTAPEIHEEHSLATQIGTEAMYRLIYNRVIAKKLFSLDGAFWPRNEPIPEGWDISMSKRDAAEEEHPKGKR